jgi:hypothetical protein
VAQEVQFLPSIFKVLGLTSTVPQKKSDCVSHKKSLPVKFWFAYGSTLDARTTLG